MKPLCPSVNPLKVAIPWPVDVAVLDRSKQ